MTAFASRTGDGVLRHPSWRGLRSDKDPADIVREVPPRRQVS
jgi:bifunctional non-homologous end joining protein LigD